MLNPRGASHEMPNLRYVVRPAATVAFFDFAGHTISEIGVVCKKPIHGQEGRPHLILEDEFIGAAVGGNKLKNATSAVHNIARSVDWHLLTTRDRSNSRLFALTDKAGP